MVLICVSLTAVSAADNTFADVQSLIDSADDGDEIFLNNTTYYGNQSITVNKNNVTIYGGFDTDATKKSTLIADHTRIMSVTGDNVTIVGVNFLNGNSAQGAGIIGTQENTIYISECSFVNNRGYNGVGTLNGYGAIQFFNNLIVMNSEFRNNTGMGTIQSNNIVLINNTFSAEEDQKAFIVNSGKLYIKDTVIDAATPVDIGITNYGTIISDTLITIYNNGTNTINSGDYVVLTAVVVTDGIKVYSGELNFLIGNETIPAEINDEGIFYAYYAGEINGSEIVSAVYSSFNNHTILKNGTVTLDDTVLIDVDISSYYTSTNITVKLPENATGEVTIFVDGKYGVVKTIDANGTVSAGFDNLTLGTHILTIQYNNYTKYLTFENRQVPLSMDVNCTVIKDDVYVEVKLPKDMTKIQISLRELKETTPGPYIPIGDDPIIIIPVNPILGSDTGEIGPIKPLYFSVRSIDVIDGVATTVFENLTEGKYTLQITNNEFSTGSSTISKYTETTYTENITVGTPMEVIIEPEIIFTDDNITVTVILPEDATGKVIYIISNLEGIWFEDVENGTATHVFTEGLMPGQYSVTVSYSGDDKYLKATKTVPITVEEHSTPMEVIIEPEIIFTDDNITVTVILPEDATGKVKYIVSTLNGFWYEDVVNGTATHVFTEGLMPGQCSVTVTYMGDDNYLSASKTVPITVNQHVKLTAEDLIKIYGNPEPYVVTLTEDGTPLANKTVTFYILGKEYNRTTNASGQAKLNINLNCGEYIITAKYENSYVQNQVTVTSSIISSDIVKMYHNGTQYRVKIVDSNGNIAANTKVTFNIVGVFYERVTDENGYATLNINLSPGNYTITALNPITNQKQSNNIEVLPTIVENYDMNMTYLDGSAFTVKLLDKQGNAVDEKVAVTFNIVGVMYTRYTNALGFAKLNINLLPGEYIITTMYDDLMVSNKITVLKP